MFKSLEKEKPKLPSKSDTYLKFPPYSLSSCLALLARKECWCDDENGLEDCSTKSKEQQQLKLNFTKNLQRTYQTNIVLPYNCSKAESKLSVSNKYSKLNTKSDELHEDIQEYVYTHTEKD